MADKIKELLEKNGQMIIDGSMSTALEQMGANLNCGRRAHWWIHRSWSKRYIRTISRRVRIAALPAAIRQRFPA